MEYAGLESLTPLSSAIVTDTLYAAGSSLEPEVTSMMVNIIQKNGGHMVQLDYRLKSRNTLQTKLEYLLKNQQGEHPGMVISLADVHAANCTSASPINGMPKHQQRLLATDVLRYTAVFPEETYASAVASVRAAWEGNGSKPHEQKNFWPRNATGLQMTFLGIIDTLIYPTTLLPCGRLVLEVQFMTEASLQHKSEIHDLFVVFRGGPTLALRVHAQALMMRLAQAVPAPAGVDALPKNMSQKRVTLTKAFLASMPSRMEALPDGVLQLLDSNPVSSEELERLVPDYDDDDVKKGRQRSLEVLMLLALQRSPIDALKALFAAPAQVSGRVIPQAFNLTCCGIRRMGVIQPNLLRYPDRTTRSSSCIPTSSSSCASGCCNASSCTSYF